MSILELLSVALINSKAALTNNASDVEGTKNEGISTQSQISLQTTNIWVKLMMKQSQWNTSPISIQIFFMDGPSANLFPLEISSGCSSET